MAVRVLRVIIDKYLVGITARSAKSPESAVREKYRAPGLLDEASTVMSTLLSFLGNGKSSLGRMEI